MKTLSKEMERRRHKRFHVVGSPIAMMSPGPSVPGKVTCISPESVEIVYDAIGGVMPAETEALDILAADFIRPIYLESLSVEVVSDHAAGGPRAPAERKRVLAFKRMTAEQRHQLQSFIYSFAY